MASEFEPNNSKVRPTTTAGAPTTTAGISYNPFSNYSNLSEFIGYWKDTSEPQYKKVIIEISNNDKLKYKITNLNNCHEYIESNINIFHDVETGVIKDNVNGSKNSNDYILNINDSGILSRVAFENNRY